MTMRRFLALALAFLAAPLAAQTGGTPFWLTYVVPGTIPPSGLGLISGSALPFNVQDYGAKCDGRTDDTQAFQSAMAAASANVAFFGTTLVGTPTVVVPSTRASAVGDTAACVLSSPITLARGVNLVGSGTFAPMIKITHANVAFSFYGTAEAQTANIRIANLFVFKSGASGTGIAFRFRNFDFVQFQNVQISGFRVGLWGDWGIHLTSYNCAYTLNRRSLQVGGNLSQTETPVPPAGIRAGGFPDFMDDVLVEFSSFAQDSLDINDLGSQKSLGGITVFSSSFFESSTTPVTGKVRFITMTKRKGASIYDNWFEEGNASRIEVQLDSVDADGNVQTPVFGANIWGNHFLYTSNSGGNVILVKRCGGCAIWGNVMEYDNSGTTAAITDQDPGSSTPLWIGPNAYLQYPDIETGVATQGIVAGGGQAPNIVRPGNQVVTIGFATNMTVNAAAGEFQSVTATSNAANNFTAPQNQRPGFLTLEVFNNSGAAMATTTFAGGAGGYILTGGAWTAPANTLRRSITFYFSRNKNAWVELSRTAADF